MATALHNLSDYNPQEIPCGEKMRIGIVVAQWNEHITEQLLQGAVSTLKEHGVKEENILTTHVPGSFELIYGAKTLAYNSELKLDAIIVLGCVIQGDTPHFDYVCSGVTQGVANLNSNKKCDLPVIFGLLTTLDEQQSLDRAGGKHGNKGTEAAVTALKMVDYSWKFQK